MCRQEGLEWSAVMKKRNRKNPHAVALARLGGLVRSEAKRRANRENGRKGGLVKSHRKAIAARLNVRASAPRSPQEAIKVMIASIRARFGDGAIGLDGRSIRFAEAGGRGVSHALTA
jgi:hypothetical protein